MNLLFIMKFVLLTGLVYSIYRLTLHTTKIFLIKRIILISTPLILAFASLVTIDSGVAIIPLENIGITNSENIKTASNWSIDINQILLTIYLIGILVALTYKGLGIRNLYKFFTETYKVNQIGNIRIYENRSKYNLSFFNNILLEKTLNQFEKHKIIEHELVHIEKYHSYDNIIFTFFSVVFWFNPFVYLMQRELRITHEFEVDNELFNNEFEIISPYTKNLIYSSIANNYTFNNIKRRVEMRNNNNNRKLPIVYAILTTIILSSMMILGTNTTYAGDKAEVTKQPIYIGDMMTTLSNNLKYPKSAYEEGIEGKTIVQLTISKDGTIKSSSVSASSGNKELDKEALRAVEYLKEWNPGEKDGKTIDVAVQIPIKFKLPKE